MSWIEDPGVKTFEGLNISDLYVDEAWLTVKTDNQTPPLWLYSVSANCHQCSFQRLSSSPILANVREAFKISSEFPLQFRLRNDGNDTIAPSQTPDPNTFCELPLSPGEFGVYQIDVHGAERKCVEITLLNPVNIYIPIFICFAVFLLALWIMNVVMKRLAAGKQTAASATTAATPITSQTRLLEDIAASSSNSNTSSQTSAEHGDSSEETVTPKGSQGRSKSKSKKKKLPTDAPLIPSEQTSQQTFPPAGIRLEKKRFHSLDAFRGLCILIMIFADDGGGLYYFFEHCSWNGLYFADVAFPWFLWIMGVSLSISIQSQRRAHPKSVILRKVGLRSLKLILLGIFLNTTGKSKPVQLGNLRILGVLQRIGICHFISAVLLLMFHDEDGNASPGRNNFFLKIKQSIPWVFFTFSVLCHTLLIFFLPVPGCPTGYLGPGGLHNDSSYPSHCIGGAAGYIDRLILRPQHIYRFSTPSKVYGSGVFDPEGILGFLTSLFQVWLGVQAGLALHSGQPFRRLLAWSTLCIICAAPLIAFGWIPLNKNLWSLSFVLVTSGLAFFLLSIFLFLIDLKEGWKWSGWPLKEMGMNSILLYTAHIAFQSTLPFHFKIGKMNRHVFHLGETLWGTFLWIMFAVYLYQRKIFFVI